MWLVFQGFFIIDRKKYSKYREDKIIIRIIQIDNFRFGDFVGWDFFLSFIVLVMLNVRYRKIIYFKLVFSFVLIISVCNYFCFICVDFLLVVEKIKNFRLLSEWVCKRIYVFKLI